MFGLLLNAFLRTSIVYFLGEVLLHKDDHRFAGKALGLRNLLIVGGLSLLFPTFHFLGKRWRTYPFGQDNLYLSIFWLDMVGNSLDLYDTHDHFDFLPHVHGTGALALTLRALGSPSALSAAGLANMIHVALEIQEYYTDVLFGTHNVRGTFDVIDDLAAGLLGSTLYATAHALLTRGTQHRSVELLPLPVREKVS